MIYQSLTIFCGLLALGSAMSTVQVVNTNANMQAQNQNQNQNQYPQYYNNRPYNNYYPSGGMRNYNQDPYNGQYGNNGYRYKRQATVVSASPVPSVVVSSPTAGVIVPVPVSVSSAAGPITPIIKEANSQYQYQGSNQYDERINPLYSNGGNSGSSDYSSNGLPFAVGSDAYRYHEANQYQLQGNVQSRVEGDPRYENQFNNRYQSQQQGALYRQRFQY